MRGICVFYLAVLVSSLLTYAMGTAPDECREPRNVDKILRRLRSQMNDDSLSGQGTMYTVPKFRESRKSVDASKMHLYSLFSGYGRRHLLTRIHGASKCSEVIKPRKSDGLDVKSTCPWHVALHYDVDRIPSIMAKARCTCKTCLSSKVSTCAPINSYIPVIRRYCHPKRRVYRYGITMETVPVGCTCKRNTIISTIEGK